MRKFITIEEDSIVTKTTLEENTITAVRSEAAIWNDSAKGEFIGKLKDTGNNIKLQIGDKKLKLNYAEFTELFDLMVIKNITDPNLRPSDTQIVEI